MPTAELSHHAEEHDRNGLIVEKRRSWVRKTEEKKHEHESSWLNP